MKHHLISCPIFAKELEAVLAENAQPPLVRFMDYTVHNCAATMEKELHRSIRTAREDGAAITFLVGRECKAHQPIRHIADTCCGSLPDGQNCIEIILGKEKARELQQNRTTLMTPAWMQMITNSINDGHWTKEDARINLGWYDQILLLDTGVEPLDEAMILDFFELTQVPIDILPITLDHFRKVVQGLLSAP